jgi:hypothetical protein
MQKSRTHEGFALNRISGEYKEAESRKDEKARGLLINAIDQRRRDLLGKLEIEFKMPVVAYIANPKHAGATLNNNDEKAMADLVRYALDRSGEVLLVLDTQGGDAAYVMKQVRGFWSLFSNGYSVAVPHAAKSGGTMIAIGAKKIFMGENSEMGPIDPIMVFKNAKNGITRCSAKTYISCFDNLQAQLRVEIDERIRGLLEKMITKSIDPFRLEECREAIEIVKEHAEELLKNGAMSGKQQAQIAYAIEQLILGRRHRFHGSAIRAEEAEEMLKLNVERLEFGDTRWTLLWEYYLRASADMLRNNTAKLFENKEDTLSVEIVHADLGRAAKDSKRR